MYYKVQHYAIFKANLFFMQTTTTDDIDLLVLSEDEKLNVEKLQGIYKDVTYVQAMRGFYDGCKIGKKFLAVLSVILALGTPLLFAEKMPSISAIVFFIGVCILVGIEFAKEKTLKNMNKIRIVNKKKKVQIPTKRLYLAFITLMCFDVSFGFFGSSHIVDTLMPVQGIVETSSLDTVFAKREALDTMQLYNSKASFVAKAAEIHTKNHWQGVTVKDARAAQLEMEVRAAKVQDSILSVLAVISADKRIAVNELKAKNEAIFKKHTSFCYGLGWVAAIIATLINLFLVVLSKWGADFDEKVLQDAKARMDILAQGQIVKGTDIHTPANTLPLPSKNAKGKREKVFSSANLAPTMQFKQGEPSTNSLEPKEGDILPPNGKGVHRIWIEVNGVLDARTKGQLGTLKAAQGNKESERAKYIQELINKLP